MSAMETGSPDASLQCPSCRREFTLSNKETMLIDKPAQSPPSPGSRLGGYLIQREIGRGGMGIVYEGLQESLGRKVAIKVMYPKHSKEPQFVARFTREARSLANLNHPNIVGILDRGQENGVFYFVMEYVEGVSLRQLLSQGRMPSKQALAIVPKICEALEYAHSQGVIHRDIKPENILIDKLGNVKIADFGLSKIVSGEASQPGITQSNILMGTVDYMAPEQRVDSKSVDHRADIFSLGVVFYELLTGELPIGRFDPPSKKNVEIDVRIDEVVLKILDRNPAMRYQRASDVGSEITNITSTPARAAAAPHARAEKNLLEKIEDRWESWVLAGIVVLFFLSPGTNWVLFIAWGILYKHIKDKRRAAAPSARSGERIPVPPSRGGFEDPARAAAPAGAPAPPRRSEAEAVVERPSISILAVLVLIYSFMMLLVFPLGLPFKDELMAQFSSLPLDVMAIALSALAAGVVPGFAGLVLGIIARGRISANPMLTGRFMATLAIIASVVYIGNFGTQWYGAYNEYRHWKDLRDGAVRGDAGSVALLKECLKSGRAAKALQIASDMNPDSAMEFCSFALSGHGTDTETAAVRAMSGLAMRGKSEDVEKTFLSLISDSKRDLKVREEVISSSSSLPQRSASSVLSAGARSQSAEVRRFTARELGTFAVDGGEDLLAALAADQSRDVAREAVRALGKRTSFSGSERRAEVLGSALALSPDRETREEALEALKAMTEEGESFPICILRFLSDAAKSDPSAEMREKAVRALEKATRRLRAGGKSEARQGGEPDGGRE